MKQYLDALREILHDGTRQQNRTGIDTLFVPGICLKFDLRQGFPILTTKKVNFDAIKAELRGFIRGAESAKDFRALGTKIWDANANDPKANGGKWNNSVHRKGLDDLGRIYGAQWRRWRGVIATEDKPVLVVVDQLAKALDMLQRDPTSRRIIINAWQPAELDLMALPPCHLLHQYLVEQSSGTLHMTMFQRSCDMFLGVPFNISSYALLLALVAKATGYKPGRLTMMLSDAHIYVNHLDQVAEQLSRECRPLPSLRLADIWQYGKVTPLQYLEELSNEDIVLEGYDPHPPIKAEMAA